MRTFLAARFIPALILSTGLLSQAQAECQATYEVSTLITMVKLKTPASQPEATENNLFVTDKNSTQIQPARPAISYGSLSSDNAAPIFSFSPSFSETISFTEENGVTYGSYKPEFFTGDTQIPLSFSFHANNEAKDLVWEPEVRNGISNEDAFKEILEKILSLNQKPIKVCQLKSFKMEVAIGIETIKVTYNFKAQISQAEDASIAMPAIPLTPAEI